MSYSLELVKGTDVGRTRRTNEDCVGIDADKGLFVLADGMGGHNAGEIASAMAVDLLLKSLAEIQRKTKIGRDGWEQSVLDQMELAIIDCNREIYEAGQRQSHMKGMGTTVVTGMVVEEQLFYAHVGDSRLYRLRGSRLDQLTEDHTLLQEVKSGSMNSEMGFASTIPGNIVTRALGAGADVEPDTATTYLQDRDLFLSCSDGLNDRLPDEVIQKIIASSQSLAPMVAELILLANEAGGEDNISVVLMGVRQGSLMDGIKKIFR